MPSQIITVPEIGLTDRTFEQFDHKFEFESIKVKNVNQTNMLKLKRSLLPFLRSSNRVIHFPVFPLCLFISLFLFDSTAAGTNRSSHFQGAVFDVSESGQPGGKLFTFFLRIKDFALG